MLSQINLLVFVLTVETEDSSWSSFLGIVRAAPRISGLLEAPPKNLPPGPVNGPPEPHSPRAHCSLECRHAPRAIRTIFSALLLRYVQGSSGGGSFPSVPTAAHPPPPARPYSGELVVVGTWSKTHSYCPRTWPVDSPPFSGLLLGQLVRSRHIYSPLSPLAHSCLVHFVCPLYHPSIRPMPILLSLFVLGSQALFFSVAAEDHPYLNKIDRRFLFVS